MDNVEDPISSSVCAHNLAIQGNGVVSKEELVFVVCGRVGVDLVLGVNLLLDEGAGTFECWEQTHDVESHADIRTTNLG